MKRAVSISIGSPKRDKAVTVNLLGEQISIERIGTNGDMEAAALKYKELDGKVDAFGVGGADLGLMVDGKWYRLYSVEKMVRFIKETPWAHIDIAGVAWSKKAGPVTPKGATAFGVRLLERLVADRYESK